MRFFELYNGKFHRMAPTGRLKPPNSSRLDPVSPCQDQPDNIAATKHWLPRSDYASLCLPTCYGANWEDYKMLRH